MRLVGPCLVRSSQTARHTAQIPRPSSDPNGSFAVTVLSLPDTLQTAASGCEEPANPAVITQRSKDSLLGGLASAVPHFASPAANQGRASTEELGASFIAAGLNWVSRRFAMAHGAHCCPGARLLSPCLALCCALRFPREEWSAAVLAHAKPLSNI